MAEILAGLARHALTALGVALIGEGSVIGSDDVATVAGALVTIGSVAWSVYSKRRALKKAQGDCP